MIVVGVDGSEGSLAAFRWALAEAELRGTDVLALYAWSMPAPPAYMGFYPGPWQDASPYRDGAEKLLERAVAGVERPAGIRLETRVVEGSAAEALVRAASEADLLVVGSRGHGGFTSLLLGSVSQQCSHHAECPLVIVPGPERGPRPE